MLPVNTNIQSSPRNKQCKLPVVKDEVNCHLFRNRIEKNISKYTIYYVNAAIGTLRFKLGQNMMWNIALEKRQKLDRKLNGHDTR